MGEYNDPWKPYAKSARIAGEFGLPSAIYQIESRPTKAGLETFRLVVGGTERFIDKPLYVIREELKKIKTGKRKNKGKQFPRQKQRLSRSGNGRKLR